MKKLASLLFAALFVVTLGTSVQAQTAAATSAQEPVKTKTECKDSKDCKDKKKADCKDGSCHSKKDKKKKMKKEVKQVEAKKDLAAESK